MKEDVIYWALIVALWITITVTCVLSAWLSILIARYQFNLKNVEHERDRLHAMMKQYHFGVAKKTHDH
jgi:hypothetical protein